MLCSPLMAIRPNARNPDCFIVFCFIVFCILLVVFGTVMVSENPEWAFYRYCQVDVERANLSRRADFLCSHRTAQVTSCQTMKARSRSSR